MGNIELRKIQHGWSFLNKDTELLSISTEDYLILRLYEKECFTQEEYEEVCRYTEDKRAKRIAQESNLYKNKSRKELITRLVQKGIEEELANCTIQAMEERGEIDEKNIIERFIRDRLKFNPKSKNFLKYELIKKGFGDEDIELTIEALSLNDEDIARDLINKRKRKFKSPEESIRYLKNKGFNFHTIKQIISIKNEDFD